MLKLGKDIRVMLCSLFVGRCVLSTLVEEEICSSLTVFHLISLCQCSKKRGFV